MSELTRRRVLILGRFIGRRLAVLEAIQRSPRRVTRTSYLPELFTFDKPESRDLVEAIIGFAALSRFVIADLSEPKSVPPELERHRAYFPVGADRPAPQSRRKGLRQFRGDLGAAAERRAADGPLP